MVEEREKEGEGLPNTISEELSCISGSNASNKWSIIEHMEHKMEHTEHKMELKEHKIEHTEHKMEHN